MNALRAMPARTETENDPRWAAVVARDRKADGAFFYSVKTTGVYCRPSCAARRPNPKNVRFHRDRGRSRARRVPAVQALQAGPAAARRAAGGAGRRDLPRSSKDAERHADARRRSPERAGLSPYHFHRVFKAVTGVTPKAYAAAQRARARARRAGARSDTVTEAIYDAGFNSSGRFYDESDRMLGMTPTDYRAGGADTEIRFAVGECSLGAILVAQQRERACARSCSATIRTRWCAISRTDSRRRELIGGDTDLRGARGQGGRLRRGAGGSGSTCRWTCAAPRSSSASGGRCARSRRARPRATPRSPSRIGAPQGGARRGAGLRRQPARGGDPLPPRRAHRRRLSGYRWGVERKRALLEREGAA